MRRFFFNASLNSNSKPLGSSNSNDVLDSSNNPNKFGRLNDLKLNTSLILPDEVYHHWCRVLRAKVGDQSIFFDGLGGESIVELETIDKKTATARVVSHCTNDKAPEFYSTIAIVMSRGDRMDYAIQKSTELGATAIQLLTSQYGEMRLKTNQVEKKLNHWQQVAISACEQCGLNRPTLVFSPVSIAEWLQGKTGEVHDTVKYLLTVPFYQSYLNQQPLLIVLAVPSREELATIDVDSSITNQFKTASEDQSTPLPRFDILIGAEGGLSDNEYQLARSANYIPWQLGNLVLRTETAPVVALSTLLYISSI